MEFGVRVSALGKTGAVAAMRNWWFRNEPPNAE
jgi:hypothetical protein